MPWVVDGNNAAGGRGRERVRSAALALARAERLSLIVFFDGEPPPGSPQIERLGAVEVRYVPHADTAITGLIGAVGRSWKVVTDDRALASRARGVGAEIVAVAAFWARATPTGAVKAARDARVDISAELDYFSERTNRLDGDEPVRVGHPRRSRGRRPGRKP